MPQLLQNIRLSLITFQTTLLPITRKLLSNNVTSRCAQNVVETQFSSAQWRILSITSFLAIEANHIQAVTRVQSKMC